MALNINAWQIRLTRHFQSLKRRLFAPGGLSIFLLCALAGTAAAQKVTLDLKDGDKITGLIVSEDASKVVISNAWVTALSIPLSNISKRETNVVTQIQPPAPPPVKKETSPPAKPAPAPAAKPAAKLPPKPKGKFHAQINVGLDAIFNTTDQQNYFGNLKLTYERPYDSNPKKFFRNTSQVDVAYQKTDGRESANHAQGSNKSDFDIGKKYYAYGLLGAGYDDIQKIDAQFQVGPGVGSHLLQLKNYVLNVESGMDYEIQYRRDISNLETFYVRLGADSTWSIRKDLKLTMNEAFFTDLEHDGKYRNEFTSTLSYGFWKNLSLNLTVLDNYNTEVAPGVNQNLFEIRSSVGFTF
jgi:putative salt-induced outer membrane protein YdiY